MRKRQKDISQTATLLMMAAVLLIGLGQMALMPPFEGFDEVAHYSSIRQVAETGTIPIMRHSFISPDVIEYRHHGPMPFHVPITHTLKPITYGEDETTSYAAFFAKPADPEIYRNRYRQVTPRAAYEPVTEEFNWEAQHPPLYYILMAPFMKVSDHLSFVSQIFVLRFISFLIACAGLWFGMQGTLSFFQKSVPQPFLRAGFLLYPFLLPMFFLEFARISNDCLSLFFFGAVWNFTLRWMRGQKGPLFNASFGLTFGCGLLTKTLFLPVLLGFSALAFFHIYEKKDWQRVRGLVTILFITLLLGCSWYVTQKVLTGSFTGSFNAIMLDKQGGLLRGLEDHFNFLRLFREIGFFIFSWSWLFSQSNTYIGPLLHAPLFLLTLWLVATYVRDAWKKKLSSDLWLPLFYALPFVAALIWYVFICIAVGWDVAPGWYMQVIAPAFAVMIGAALHILMRKQEPRRFVKLGLFYSVLFLAIVNWAQASLFAGCALRSEAGLYKFPNNSFCLDHFSEVSSHLAITGWPLLGLTAYLAGFSCLILGILKLQKLLRAARKAP